ncbi:hypothetical protein QO010_003697 [Caulobacter ginsengisoli]|uniref:Coenzyme Q-binding protein COQ10 START domain-containing protein n=1 Tax=Caulobacter ginsengisoli TaxID=400775 RepID=A0ABU0IV73_9CAUL|nr:SRPBCC family protein [Caulobacter ginsengisoli]MDQ0465905.1 hypothetical protein [Caulobacter ginsengisoli]
MPIALLLLLAAPAAQAAGPPASAEGLLGKGGVWVISSPDPDKVSARVQAAIDIPVSPEKVWRTMTDCKNSYKLITNLKSCKIVQGDMAKGWDVREHVTKGGLVPSMRIVFRSDYTAYTVIRFKLVEGDLKVEQGEWRLISLRNGTATRVVYDNRLALNLPVPQDLLANGLKKSTPKALTNLRDLCVAQAKG